MKCDEDCWDVSIADAVNQVDDFEIFVFQSID